MDTKDRIAISLMFIGLFALNTLFYFVKDCPDCSCPYERLSYERNCRMMSEKIRDQLIRDGYNASILNVWSPHSMVNCSDCREDGEIWFDSDGSAILGRDKEKYVVMRKRLDETI